MASFLDDSLAGTRLETLSKICAALKIDPVRLLQRHERYNPESGVAFAEDSVFDSFRALLERDEAARLIRILNALLERGATDQVFTAAEAMLGLDDGAGRQKRPTPRAKSRRR